MRSAVEDTVRKFGGIDILVNNASAISLTGTLETSMKKYDLMMGVNARGTYLWYVGNVTVTICDVCFSCTKGRLYVYTLEIFNYIIHNSSCVDICISFL